MSKNRTSRKAWKQEYRRRKRKERLEVKDIFGITDITAYNAECLIKREYHRLIMKA